MQDNIFNRNLKCSSAQSSCRPSTNIYWAFNHALIFVLQLVVAAKEAFLIIMCLFFTLYGILINTSLSCSTRYYIFKFTFYSSFNLNKLYWYKKNRALMILVFYVFKSLLFMPTIWRQNVPNYVKTIRKLQNTFITSDYCKLITLFPSHRIIAHYTYFLSTIATCKIKTLCKASTLLK